MRRSSPCAWGLRGLGSGVCCTGTKARCYACIRSGAFSSAACCIAATLAGSSRAPCRRPTPACFSLGPPASSWAAAAQQPSPRRRPAFRSGSRPCSSSSSCQRQAPPPEPTGPRSASLHLRVVCPALAAAGCTASCSSDLTGCLVDISLTSYSFVDRLCCAGCWLCCCLGCGPGRSRLEVPPWLV